MSLYIQIRRCTLDFCQVWIIRPDLSVLFGILPLYWRTRQCLYPIAYLIKKSPDLGSERELGLFN